MSHDEILTEIEKHYKIIDDCNLLIKKSESEIIDLYYKLSVVCKHRNANMCKEIKLGCSFSGCPVINNNKVHYVTTFGYR